MLLQTHTFIHIHYHFCTSAGNRDEIKRKLDTNKERRRRTGKKEDPERERDGEKIH